MGEFSVDSLIPRTITAPLNTSSQTASTGNIEDDQQIASNMPVQIFEVKETVQEVNRRKRAEYLVKSWRALNTEEKDSDQPENIDPAVLVPGSRQAESDSTSPAISQGNGEAEGRTTSLAWRANASPPQGEPILSWPDVASSYRPGQIVWVPSHDDMSKDSILHGHEDFGIDPADPAGLAYQQAYAHPALVWKKDDMDDCMFVCLKITSWSDWNDIPGGKWDACSPAASDRRRLYVPLFSTGKPLWQEMPILVFEEGKNMPEREGAVENRSYVNIERVFLIEKEGLRDFRLGCQKHELFLSEDSMSKLEDYRSRLGRSHLVDMLTLANQRREHKEWLRCLKPSTPQAPTPQPNGVIWPRSKLRDQDR
ncbi:hypothetical protein BLS_000492 [Venturia inaequalis]|uniref:Uncharacterized protein n=1 Tax=Venturia inaequalis TaxID=5025 RepID=A0A8H3ZD46_VENIN|nr:hypothetical protein BLS_000492 [Venturia inaequalis]KAE9988932.1 hypothetical protein EG328_005642 [Venturia inaequalis]